MTQDRRKLFLPIVFFCLFCTANFLGGCSGKHSGQDSSLSFNLKAKEEETPLTDKEIMVLNSTGQVDKNLPRSAMADLTREYKKFLRGEGRSSMQQLAQRAEKYLYYTQSIFKKRKMPEELAYLAIIESGYRPNAKSRAGAAGAWQFMPPTAKRFGLEQDKWTDERLDLFASTEAAATYLQKLYNNFGDWPTAIAAYNAGEGKIQRAKQGTGGHNFFEVRERNETLPEEARLKEETKQYVPRFLAVTKIMRNLPGLDFQPIHPENAPRYKRLNVEPNTNLQALSRQLNLKWEEFNSYNQHHKSSVTSAMRPTFVYIPEDLESRAIAYLHKQSAPQTTGIQVAWKKKESAPTTVTQHKLQKAETLYAVAKKYNVSMEDLQKYNNISNPNQLSVGMVLRIPSANQSAPTPLHGGSDGSIGKKRSVQIYTVQAGDNLWKIAKRHSISVDKLKRWNKVDEKTLQVGDSLLVNLE